MKIILDDTFITDFLYPFTAIRHSATIRCGILTLQEKWEKILGEPVILEQKKDFNEILDVETDLPVIIGANIVPTKQWVSLLLKSGNTGTFDDEEIVKTIKHPWEIFQFNDWAIRQDFELITGGRQSGPLSTSNTVIAPENIFIEPGADVEHCILNAANGPVYIGKNATIMEGSMIRGPFAICEGAVVKMGSKIYGATTIGPYCIAGGEIKNSVISGYSNKAHDGYLGDSVIGEWCNLGAGTSTSNVKNNAGIVKVWNRSAKEYTAVGLKCGLLMGDHSSTAINISFNTGTVVGTCCNIFGDKFPAKFIPDFSWGLERYQFEKVLQDISNWKKLKGMDISDKEKELLIDHYSQKK